MADKGYVCDDFPLFQRTWNHCSMIIRHHLAQIAENHLEDHPGVFRRRTFLPYFFNMCPVEDFRIVIERYIRTQDPAPKHSESSARLERLSDCFWNRYHVVLCFRIRLELGVATVDTYLSILGT